MEVIMEAGVAHGTTAKSRKNGGLAALVSGSPPKASDVPLLKLNLYRKYFMRNIFKRERHIISSICKI